MRGNEAIHAGHCSRYACVYGDEQCPVATETLPGGRAERAMEVLRSAGKEDLAPLLGRRYRECAERFGVEDEFNPMCDRWPKSCSPYPYPEAIAAGNVTEAHLEPLRPAGVVSEADPCQPLAPICDTCGFRHPVDTSLTSEFAVRNTDTGWVYALPKILPKFLAGKRGTRECAEWHLRQVGGPDPEDQIGFEIIERPVGAWKVSD